MIMHYGYGPLWYKADPEQWDCLCVSRPPFPTLPWRLWGSARGRCPDGERELRGIDEVHVPLGVPSKRAGSGVTTRRL